MDAVQDIYALGIHIIKVYREGQECEFPTYPVPEFLVGDKVLEITQ